MPNGGSLEYDVSDRTNEQPLKAFRDVVIKNFQIRFVKPTKFTAYAYYHVACA